MAVSIVSSSSTNKQPVLAQPTYLPRSFPTHYQQECYPTRCSNRGEAYRGRRVGCADDATAVQSNAQNNATRRCRKHKDPETFSGYRKMIRRREFLNFWLHIEHGTVRIRLKSTWKEDLLTCACDLVCRWSSCWQTTYSQILLLLESVPRTPPRVTTSDSRETMDGAANTGYTAGKQSAPKRDQSTARSH